MRSDGSCRHKALMIDSALREILYGNCTLKESLDFSFEVIKLPVNTAQNALINCQVVLGSERSTL